MCDIGAIRSKNVRASEYLVLISFIVFWLIMPVLSILAMCFTLHFNSCFLRHRKVFYVLISLTFAFIAYTQRSISGTDIERYYGMFYGFINVSMGEVDFTPLLSENLYFVFTPVSIFIVSLFENVQYFSLFWIFVVYYFYFLACENYCLYRKINLIRSQFLIFVVVSVFGFILFTQVTEVIKQAVATSLFFYGFTLFLLKKMKSCFLTIFLTIGIHSTALFLLPIFFYRWFNTKTIWSFVLFAFILSTCNIMEFFVSILPNYGIFQLLHEKALEYVDPMSGFASSYLRYDLLMLISSCLLYVLFVANHSFKESKIWLFFLIYLCLVIANRSMTHNYVRFVNMSYPIYAFLFLELLSIPSSYLSAKICYIKLFSLLAFFVANFHMTYYRTIGGSYLSSYMDNSLFNILFSSVPTYLSFVAF